MSQQLPTTNSVALDVIVREWMGSTKNEPLDCTKVFSRIEMTRGSVDRVYLETLKIQRMFNELISKDKKSERNDD